MLKTDFSRKYKAYYTAKTRPELIRIEPASYLSIQGTGDPSGLDLQTSSKLCTASLMP